MTFAAPDPTTLVHDRFTPVVAAAAGGGDGAPTPEEMAAVLAAVQELWPRPVVLVADDRREPDPWAWRFSGRWWSRPLVTRRDRP